MTKDQIQALIDSAINGQGNQVDSGGKLAQILTGILKIAAAGGNVQSDWNQTDDKKEDYIKNKPSIPAPYTLPVATADILGGVKVGDGLMADEAGKLSLNIPVITEDLSDGAVTIPEARFFEIINSTLVCWEDKICPLTTMAPSNFGIENDFNRGCIFAGSLTLANDGTVNGCHVIACYEKTDNSYTLVELDI